MDIVLGQDMNDNPLFIFASSLRPRDILEKMKFFTESVERRVGVLYGLRRTGKSVLLRQWLMGLPEDLKKKAAYITVDSESLYDIKKDLKTLRENGYRYVALDEITICKDFIDYSAPLADMFAGSGMKIFLAGTDSLSLWLTSVGRLFDRDYILHTTAISFAEWKRLFGNVTLDDYIRFGGLLHHEPTEGEDRHSPPLPWTAQAVRQYFSASISSNIQNSLRNYKDGERAGILSDLLYSSTMDEAVYGLFGSVTRQEFIKTMEGLSSICEKNFHSALQSVVSHNGHKFNPQIMRKKFKPSDISRTAHALAKKDLKLHDILHRLAIDLRSNAEKILQVRDVNNTLLTSAQFIEIEKYLRRLEVFAMRPSRAFLPVSPSIEDVENYEQLNIELNTQNIVVQPGLRFSQADILLSIIETSQIYNLLDSDEKEKIRKYFLDGVYGIMQEDIVLYETMQLCKKYGCMNPGDNDISRYMSLPVNAYRAEFPGTSLDPMDKEIDMIIEDSREDREFYCFEIKHSDKCDINQAKWIDDADVCSRIQCNSGKIVSKVILYRGDSCTIDDNIRYLNIESYLDMIYSHDIISILDFLKIKK